MKNFKLGLFALFVLFILYCVYFLTYTFVEPKAYDFMVRNVLTEALPFDHNKNTYGHGDIVIILIDAKTNDKYRWPWKRDRVSKLLKFFKEYTAPRAIMHDQLILTLDKENPSADKQYFSTVNNFENLVEGFMPNINYWEEYGISEQEGNAYEQNFKQKHAIMPYQGKVKPILFNSMAKFPQPYFDVVKNAGHVINLPGFFDGNFISDEIYRTTQNFINYKGVLYPSLAMKTFLLINNNPNVKLTDNEISFDKLNYRIKQKTTDYIMFTPIRYYKFYEGYSHPVVSAVDILDSYDNIKNGKKPIINPALFNDKIIVIGANVPATKGLNDNLNSPMTANHPGVDIQATVIDNLTHRDFLNLIPQWLNLIVTLLGMLFVYYTIRCHNIIKSVIYTIIMIVIYLAAASTAFYYAVIVNVITPPVMFVITMIIAYVHRYIIEARNKEKVKMAMSKYMSEDVMEKVIQNIDHLGLGGKKATVTVLFSDIRGFTSMSEKMSAGQVSELLNEYFSEMEPIITKYNGIINKFIGDAIMAVFGEPIQDENHPKNAVKCGLEMLQKVQELHQKWEKEGKPLIEIGIGANTGEVFVGNIGSTKRMEYTVIGDTVNLASRLEGYNKTYQTKFLISSSTYEASQDIIDINKISDVEIRGKSHKMDIYEVLRIK